MGELFTNPIYAIRDGRIVSIDEVSRGKECNCICPKCNGSLIAKKGDKRVHHFAHLSKDDCDYSYLESITEKIKELLLETKMLCIPTVSARINGKDTILTSSKCISVESVEINNILSQKLASVQITFNNVCLILHVLINRKIATGLREKLERLGISGIGIDVSNINYFEINNLISKIITEPSDIKFWLYNLKAAKFEKEYKKDNLVVSDITINERIPCKNTIECDKEDSSILETNFQNIEEKDNDSFVDKLNKLFDTELRKKAMQVLNERAKLGASEEARKPLNIIKELRAEYNEGKTEWAIKLRSKLKK